MLDVLECSPASLLVSNRPGNVVKVRRPGSGVPAREADRSEDDMTSYLNRSAKELLGR